MATRTREPVILGAVTVAAVALLSWRPVNNDDTFMYLATGQWVTEHHRIPRTDPFSWTFLGHPWQSTGWGWGVILAACDRVAGVAGVAATKPLLVAAVAAGAIWTSRRLGARIAPAFIAVIVALVAVTPWITDRAQMASYAFFPISLGLAWRASRGRRVHLGPLAGLVAVQIVWINVHSAGLISAPFLFALLAGVALDDWRSMPRRRAAELVRVAAAPAAVWFAASCALLVNPWGWGMISHAQSTRDLSRATISEWAPLVRAGSTAFIPLAAMAAAALGFWVGRRRFSLVCVLPCVLGAAMSFDAVRNTPFLVLAVAMCVPPVLPPPPWPFRGRDLARVVAGAFGLIALVFAATTVPTTGRPGPGIPVHATAALPAGCRVRNLSGMGGYVMVTRHDVPVSADGRNDLYGLDGYAQNAWFTGTVAEAHAGRKQIDAEGTTCVLARPGNTIVDVLTGHGWRIVGRDASGVSLTRGGARRAGQS